MCSGQVYYTLLAEREKRGLMNVAISRVEQLSPLPYDLITPHLDRYPNAVQYWVQEEPINNGAWQCTFSCAKSECRTNICVCTDMQPRLETAMRETAHHQNKRIYVSGREPTSSVATGSKKQHAKEIQEVSIFSSTSALNVVLTFLFLRSSSLTELSTWRSTVRVMVDNVLMDVLPHYKLGF